MTQFLDSTNDTAKQILSARYLRKDDEGNVIETEEGMYNRVAMAIGKDESTETQKYFEMMMHEKLFMPNTPALINAGVPGRPQQTAACAVLPIPDSLEGILTTAMNAARLFASGAGVGYSFSNLRPNGDIVSTTKGTTPGPMAFMRMFDAITGTISQGGVRRGANLGVLNSNHPDIFEFIDSKRNGTLQNFNISVGIDDKFFEALSYNEPYNLINPRTEQIAKTVDAQEVFDRIVDAAWSNGDPGLLFLDTVNRNNPLNQWETIESTNACGEIPLPSYGVCILGHINLNHYVELDWVDREELVYHAVRFLDNAITYGEFTLPEITKQMHSTRRIGLGIMGFADILFDMKWRYGGEESITYLTALLNEIMGYAKIASKKIGEEKGNCDFLPRRNGTLMTIAPTGTVATICNASYGLEPYFSLAYTRTILDGTKFNEVAPALKNLDEQTIEQIIIDKGILKDKTDREYMVTALEIPYQEHIAIQSAAQSIIDNSISKSVNMSNSATKKDVENAYKMAWERGLKGITIFRDGCRDNQVFSTKG
jgi:ribonucleoside-diphosphate reductase alpha chain